MASRYAPISCNQLVIINKRLVDFEELLALGYNFHRTVSQQGWNGYFSMLFGFTYSNLVKEFCVNAYIHQLNLEFVVLFKVSGVPITIITATISNVINCEDDKVPLDIILWEHYFPINRIFVDPSKSFNVSNLRSETTMPTFCQGTRI